MIDISSMRGVPEPGHSVETIRSTGHIGPKVQESWLGSGPGMARSVARVRPSSLKRDCDGRATSTGLTDPFAEHVTPGRSAASTRSRATRFGRKEIHGKSLLVRALNALAAVISTPIAAPVIAATRLRGRNAVSARGAARLAVRAVGTAMPLLRGALEVLRSAQHPLALREIADAATERGLIAPRAGSSVNTMGGRAVQAKPQQSASPPRLLPILLPSRQTAADARGQPWNIGPAHDR